MNTEQLTWEQNTGWQLFSAQKMSAEAQLVLAFGHRECIEVPERYAELREKYPHADIILCSTSGDIIDIEVKDKGLVVTALHFLHTPIKAISAHIYNTQDSYAIGEKLSSMLDAADLKHILVFSDGQIVNGSRLVQGLNETLKMPIPISGGLAGDNARFERTSVGLNEVPGEGNVVAIGFYGEKLQI